MGERPFPDLVAGSPSLMTLCEHAVVEAHGKLWLREGRQWSLPVAYHWLRYEDPMPVERLREGVERLAALGAPFDVSQVAAAELVARKLGYPG
jgi:hypothetical protein